MVQVVLWSVSVGCAVQGHAGLWQRGGKADVGRPLMAPWGQICANYTTNYTVGCCAPQASVNNNTISPSYTMNQTELI